MHPTRRETIAGTVALTLGCGRSDLFELDLDCDPDLGPDEDLEESEMKPDSKPLYLTAKTTLASNASGGVNAIALRNPMGTPMEILSIAWTIDGAFDGKTFPRNVFGGIVACKLDLGQLQLTNGFVPVWNFGRSEQLQGEVIDSIFGPINGQRIRCQQYLWRLPRPLFIPAGGVLTPTFQHRGLFPNSLNVQIGYGCRSLPVGYKPKTICVPYAAAFVSKNFQANSVTTFDTDQSTETDLVNPFDEELKLQRFTGRAVSSQNNDLILTSDGGSVLTDRALSVRMIDSGGRPIIETSANSGFTTFRTAFSSMTRSWEMDNGVSMEPRSYYNVIVRYDSLGVPVNPFTVQSYIGLVGWRELKG